MRGLVGAISLWLGLFSTAIAWNAAGHQMIAEIALAQLTPAQQARLWHYNQAVVVGYQPRSLRQAAVWLDWVHCRQGPCKNYHYYHYIDYPYTPDGVSGMPPRSVNALTAVYHARNLLQQPGLSDAERGLQLRILMHVVGDLHQPMHAVTLYSRAFPLGDQGGNLFVLGPNRVGKKLHAYWDRGGGYLRHRGPLQQRVQALLKQYPCDVEKMNLDPRIWARESFQVAVHSAYRVSLGERPSLAYQRQTQQITQQRLALAGCRLGAILRVI